MTTTRIAQPAPPTTREARGLALYREHGHLIEKVAPDFYLVPSQDGERFYHVDYRGEVCDCADHRYRHATCVHIYAVGIARAKRRAKSARCAGCGQVHRRRDLLEVGPEQAGHGLDALEGQRFCRPCARRHGVL
ncbi:MAG: hypothetical protein M3N18_13960 [Actinomycetota bacterium]|nr:hypothetical protein [Actinomycetota bacterium]